MSGVGTSVVGVDLDNGSDGGLIKSRTHDVQPFHFRMAFEMLVTVVSSSVTAMKGGLPKQAGLSNSLQRGTLGECEVEVMEAWFEPYT